MKKKKKLTGTGAENIQWDLSDLYPGIKSEELKSDQEKVVELSKNFNAAYRGKIAGMSHVEFAEALSKYEEIIQIMGRIGSFAYLQWSTSTEDSNLGKFLQASNELSSDVSQDLTFFNVEWLQLSDEKAGRFIESEELKKWKHYLEVSRMYKSHTLTEDAEKV